MYELLPEFLERLETIAGEIQESEELHHYLEEEEESFYNTLKDTFEPVINDLYADVAARYPLQLIHLEQILLDPAFEGLFLPRILGYSVLRGTIDAEYKYTRPQHHFQDILLTICNSANFDLLKKRIGQTIQVGFALSSDIWVTNLVNAIENKRIRHYLTGLKSDRLRNISERKRDYARYERQFQHENFLSILFPETAAELTIEFPGVLRFLLYRLNEQPDNASLIAPLDAFVSNEALIGTKEHLCISAVYAGFMEAPEASRKNLSKVLTTARGQLHEADEKLLNFLLALDENPNAKMSPEADLRMASLFDRKQKDQLSDYFAVLESIHQDGYTNETAQEVVRKAYLSHEGLSPFNEGIRRTIFRYFSTFVNNLELSDYPAFFDITKLFSLYMSLFGNQQFNQRLKDLSMEYVHKLLARYTDKRGRDYQDVKKFVSTTFVEFNFLDEKDITNLFKTRRKRKSSEE
ncbi:MAG: hypothetical protein R2795_07545 [Saprospiraceae bacterium]